MVAHVMARIETPSASDFRNLPDLPENFGNDWLSNAQEILLPETVSWIPQTSAWWWLLILLTVILGCMGYAIWQQRQKTLYVRQALEHLQQLGERLGQGEPEVLAAIPELLKRVAFSCWTRVHLVPLNGEQWMRFWGNTSEEEPPLSINVVAYLNAHDLAAITPHERLALMTWAEQWIRRHRDYRRFPISQLVSPSDQPSSASPTKIVQGESA